MFKIKPGFTLVEMILSITLFAMIILVAFGALGNIGIIRIKVSDKLDINKDLYYATENLITTIKNFGGDIDYEEYWNREAIGTATNSGHYSIFSGYGNYGSGGIVGTATYGTGFYFCRSGSGVSMGTGGCLTGYNSFGDLASFSGKQQRYGEYAFQFIDYNINENNDTTNCNTQGFAGMQIGDENCDGNIRGDDDDENLGQGPVAFSGNEVKELYLLKKLINQERIFLRLNVIKDPDASSGATCNFTNLSGTGCLGNIQILKLDGLDLGLSHSGLIASIGQYDGLIDTWRCNKDFNCAGTYRLPSGADSEWVNLLPDNVNVKSLKFFIYPNKDYNYSWKENNSSININSYIRINMILGFSWKKKKQLKGSDPMINITTTVNLTKD